MTPYLRGYSHGVHLLEKNAGDLTAYQCGQYEHGYTDGWKDRQLHEATHSRLAPFAPAAPSSSAPVTDAAANAQMARDHLIIRHFLQEMDRAFRETVYNPPNVRTDVHSLSDLLAYVGYHIGWFRRAHGGLK